MAEAVPANPNTDIVIAGKEIADSEFISYVVERDMFQPDMATIVISNKNDIHSNKWTPGTPVEVRIGPGMAIYKGELVGIEGSYKGGDTTRMVVRAMNKMHRLLRKRASMTFKDMSDQEMIQKVLQDANCGLTLEFKHDKSIKYPLVYQHNLNALEFIRMRAARIGCYVWCVDTKLYVKEPDFSQVGPIKVSADKDGNLRTFTPRLNTSTAVKKVTVHSWDPEKKELITGTATQTKSSLATKDCVDNDLAADETFNVDMPLATKEEADVLAKARLRELNMQYLTGEAEINSSYEADIGTVCEITANAQDPKDPFNGKYYIVGITHRHTQTKNQEGGQTTILKLARDGEGA